MLKILICNKVDMLRFLNDFIYLMELIYLNCILINILNNFAIYFVINKLLCFSYKNKIIKAFKIESQLLLIILLLNTFIIYFYFKNSFKI